MKKSLTFALAGLLAISAAVPMIADNVTVSDKATKRTQAQKSTTTALASRDKRANAFPSVQVRTNNPISQNRKNGKGKNARPASAQLREAAGGNVDLRGYLIFADTDLEHGMWQISTTAPGNTLLGSLGQTNYGAERSPQYGGVKLGDIYYAHYIENLWGMNVTHIAQYNTSDWSLLYDFENWNGTLTFLATAMAVDPTSDLVYGSFYNEAGDGQEFGILDYDKALNYDPACHTVIATLDNPLVGMTFDADGNLFALDQEGNFLKVDKATGAQTLIGATGATPQYIGGLTTDLISGRTFWTLSSDAETALYEIDRTTGAATKLYDFPDREEFIGLYVNAPEALDAAPAAPTDLQANFENGSTAGNLTFKAPTTTFDGTAATGALSYKLLANGVEVATGETAYGEEATVPVDVQTSGHYTFSLTVSNEVGKSPKTTLSLYVGNDIPVATAVQASFADGKATVTWAPMTDATNNGFINPDEVTYTVVRYPGEVTVADGISENTFTEELATPEEITLYKYSVQATFRGIKSDISFSDTFHIGLATLPFFEDFEERDNFGLFTVIDVAGNGYGELDNKYQTWGWWSTGEACYRNMLNDADADDWLVLPGIRLEAGLAYPISLDARTGNLYNGNGILEVKVGRECTPEAMTTELVPATEVLTDTYDHITLEATFIPEEDGVYYIGIHAMDPKTSWCTDVDNISVGEGISTLVPNAVTDFKATPDFNGGKSVEVTFNAPKMNWKNETLSDLSKIELYRGEELLKTFENPSMGAALSYSDNVAEDGVVYTYTARVYNSHGEGVKAETSCFVGIPVPTEPTKVTIEEVEKGFVKIDWEAPATDENGTAINPALLTYQIQDGDNNIIAFGLTDTTCTFQAVAEGESAYVSYAIFAITDSGYSFAWTPNQFVGEPAKAPFSESFTGCQIHYPFGTFDMAGNASWGVYGDEYFSDMQSQDGDGGFIGLHGTSVGDQGSFATGKIDLSGIDKPTLSFYLWKNEASDPNTNTLDVFVSTDGKNWTSAKQFVITDLPEMGFNRVTVDLADYKNQTVFVKFTVVVNAYTYTFFDNIKIYNNLDNNLAATAIDAPEKAAAGQEFNVKATVENLGALAATGYDVVLYRNGEKAATLAGETLQLGEKKEYTFAETLNPMSEKATDYYVEIQYAADEDVSDNITEPVEVALQVRDYPTASELKVDDVNGNAHLTWTAPIAPENARAAAEGERTDDFEDGTPWANEYADWTFVDGDDAPIGGFSGLELPGHEKGSKSSFFVFNNTDAMFNATYEAHSGNQYLVAFYRQDDGLVDDWAISPELSGNAQTITFYANSYNASYLEKIEVLYSTNGTDLADFVTVMEPTVVPNGLTNSSVEWTKYTVDLPAGAKYFAIRSCSVGALMLQIDDVTFEPAPEEPLALIGYNVYRDGVKLNDAPVAETEYTDADTADGANYVVTAVYNHGESAASNVATYASGVNGIVDGALAIFANDGKIVIANAAGLNVSVANAAGVVIYEGQGDATVAVEPAIYVVRAGKKAVKLEVK